jgi:malonate-semialdehyde dehydrogenase (acetylating)/methylmalonate-semialdehyde dehydrogenase
MNTEALASIETTETVGHFINGRRVVDTARTQDVFNPATGRAVRQVALAGKATVEEAIAAAQAAFPEWRNTPAIKRARIMFRFKELLERNAGTVVALITEEHGKVMNDAEGEFMRGVENVEYACGAPELLKGEFSKNVGPAIDSWSEFQPLGVVAGITPFNFPAMVPMWMYPMALICGNTSSTATRKRWILCCTTHGSRRSPSSVPHRSPSTFTAPAPPTASGCRRLAGRKTMPS